MSEPTNDLVCVCRGYGRMDKGWRRHGDAVSLLSLISVKWLQRICFKMHIFALGKGKLSSYNKARFTFKGMTLHKEKLTKFPALPH